MKGFGGLLRSLGAELLEHGTIDRTTRQFVQQVTTAPKAEPAPEPEKPAESPPEEKPYIDTTGEEIP